MTALAETLAGPTARRQRALVAVVQLTALSCWFSATAVAPGLRADLGLSATGAVLLTSTVQLGFVAGALASAVLNLADRVPPPRLVAASATTAAACTALLPLVGQGVGRLLLLRFLAGVALAGVYPVNMKIMASWSTPAQRGRAFGVLIGALTLGSAVPQLIRGLEDLSWRGVMTGAALVTLAGAVVAALALRVGPNLQRGAPVLDPAYAVQMFRHRGPRLANLGYFGHMWELYAMWTWLPAFVLASQRAHGGSTGAVVNLVAFTAIGVAGAAGCVAGGVMSDRIGRAPAAVTALAVSGTCCLLSPVFFGGRTGVLLAFLLVWGAAVIADSGVFTTALSEVADHRLVGTALTAQTAVGFLLTALTIHLVPVLAEVTGWRWAFVVLALGPAVGATAMARFGPVHTHLVTARLAEEEAT